MPYLNDDNWHSNPLIRLKTGVIYLTDTLISPYGASTKNNELVPSKVPKRHRGRVRACIAICPFLRAVKGVWYKMGIFFTFVQDYFLAEFVAVIA
jgi:hypothetical protein